MRFFYRELSVRYCVTWHVLPCTSRDSNPQPAVCVWSNQPFTAHAFLGRWRTLPTDKIQINLTTEWLITFTYTLIRVFISESYKCVPPNPNTDIQLPSNIPWFFARAGFRLNSIIRLFHYNMIVSFCLPLFEQSVCSVIIWIILKLHYKYYYFVLAFFCYSGNIIVHCFY